MDTLGIIIGTLYVIIGFAFALWMIKCQIKLEDNDPEYDGIVWFFAAMWPLFLFLYICVVISDWATKKFRER